jgi:glycerol-3-phosphate acyltransferase PlsY
MIERCHFWFNVIEAGIWIALAGWFLFLAVRRRSSLKKTFLVFSATLFVFGISDLIETQTGAWYKPFSLFMLKAICVLFIAGCLVVLFRNRAECERVMNGKEDSQQKEE